MCASFDQSTYLSSNLGHVNDEGAVTRRGGAAQIKCGNILMMMGYRVKIMAQSKRVNRARTPDVES
jgi:hypothetical protein